MSPIHVAVVVDEPTWAPAYAAMRSVCLTTPRRADVVFHLMHCGVSAEHLEVLGRVGLEFGATLAPYDLEREALFRWLTGKARARAGRPDLGYAPLLFAEILPRDIGRLVQLAPDMLMRAPIERLADMDLFGRAAAAVADPRGPAAGTGRGMLDARGLFPPGTRLVSPALLVVGIDRWRELRLTERFEAALDGGQLAALASGAEFLNLALGADWLELGQLWNLADPLPVHEALNPFAVSYPGRAKPWRLGATTGFAGEYRQTMTDEVFYQALAERTPGWLRPVIKGLKRLGA
jgi:lipopolysaccharide biosynthesis glycosyltransferase